MTPLQFIVLSVNAQWRLGDIFASASRKASSNYGIGADGRIGMYVEEKDRSGALLMHE